jgi:hypothetical protein
MSNPALGVETSVMFKLESVPGTRESLATGAVNTDLVSETLDYIPVHTDLPQITGDRQKRATLQFVSHNDGSGTAIIRPRHAQAPAIMAWIFGALNTLEHVPIVTDSADLAKYTVEVNKAGQDTLALIGTVIDSATFRSTANGPLEIELDMVASSGERNAGVFTAWAATELDAEKPFMHSGLTFTGEPTWMADGAAGDVEARNIEFTVSNNLDREGYTNSVDRRVIPMGGFTLEGTMEVPYNATTKGFWTDVIAATKVTFSLVYTDAAAQTITIALTVKFTGELPKIADMDSQWLTLQFNGVYDGTDAYCCGVTVSV